MDLPVTGRLQPGLALAKTPDDQAVLAGDAISFTIVTSNGGPGTATATTLTDPLPAGVDWSIVAAREIGLGMESHSGRTSRSLHRIVLESCAARG